MNAFLCQIAKLALTLLLGGGVLLLAAGLVLVYTAFPWSLPVLLAAGYLLLTALQSCRRAKLL